MSFFNNEINIYFTPPSRIIAKIRKRSGKAANKSKQKKDKKMFLSNNKLKQPIVDKSSKEIASKSSKKKALEVIDLEPIVDLILTYKKELLFELEELKHYKFRRDLLIKVVKMKKIIVKIKKHLEEVKLITKNVEEQIISGQFFDWQGLLDNVLLEASKTHYITKKDRQTLDDFLKLLQAPIYCDPLDFDAYMRWILYSVDPDVNITSYLAAELERQEPIFQKKVELIMQKRTEVQDAYKRIKDNDVFNVVSYTLKLIKNLVKITKKKQLTDLDNAKIEDFILDTIDELDF